MLLPNINPVYSSLVRAQINGTCFGGIFQDLLHFQDSIKMGGKVNNPLKKCKQTLTVLEYWILET